MVAYPVPSSALHLYLKGRFKRCATIFIKILAKTRDILKQNFLFAG